MFGLVDCNNFFVSCERLFRPDLTKKPVLVLSSNDGCVVSRSQEVKDLGIPMGAPFFQIKELCTQHGVHVFSSNFPLYRDLSRRVMCALKEEVFEYEAYSIDEAFFQVKDGMSFTDFMALRNRIIQKTGIPVSVGVSFTKTLAKVASDIAKKGNGVCVLDDASWKSVRASMSCGAVWGIGRETSARLTRMGISTVDELLSAPRSRIRETLGVVGERTCLELEGTPVYALHTSRQSQASYTRSRSFGTTVHEKSVLHTALAHHIAGLAEKLREDACLATGMTVIIRGGRFSEYGQRQGSFYLDLPEPTAHTTVLLAQMRTILDAVYDPEIPYKKAGVVFHGIVPEHASMNQLFSVRQNKNTKCLDEVGDAINRMFGKHTVVRGSLLGSSLWIAKHTFVSKNYTTQWSEIPHVKAT